MHAICVPLLETILVPLFHNFFHLKCQYSVGKESEGSQEVKRRQIGDCKKRKKTVEKRNKKFDIKFVPVGSCSTPQ